MSTTTEAVVASAVRARSDGKINDIQILRAVAVILVLFEHYAILNILIKQGGIHLTNSLYIGVDLFFVVSGYVVAAAFQRDDYHALRFMVRRLFRLWPALFLVLAVCLFSSWALVEFAKGPTVEWYGTPSQETILWQFSHVLFGYYSDNDAHVYGFGPLWSLMVEMRFYAGFAAFALVTKFAAPRMIRKAVPVAALVLLVACLVGTVLIGAFGVSPRRLFPLDYLIIGRGDAILAGVLLYHYAKLSKRVSEHPRAAVAAMVLLALLALVCTALVPNEDYSKPRILDLPIVIACFSGVVWLAAHGVISRVMNRTVARVLETIGNWSYSIYVLHVALFIPTWLVFYVWAQWVFDDPIRYGVAELLVHSLMLWPVVIFSFYVIEEPMRKLGKRLLEKKSTPREVRSSHTV